MRVVLTLLAAVLASSLLAQGHEVTPAEGMKSVSFLEGEWSGKQNFDTGGAPLIGDATAHIHEAIGGRYLEESLSTVFPGRKPTDTRHFLTFDPKGGTYKAWWFNDSSVGAMELEGKLEGPKLVLLSKPTATGSGPGTIFRATYDKRSEQAFDFTLEIKQGEGWRKLFTTSYVRKG